SHLIRAAPLRVFCLCTPPRSPDLFSLGAGGEPGGGPPKSHKKASNFNTGKRREAWRPAAAACNRWPREARDPARQALRPGCEELAARSRRQLPAVVGRRGPKETEARPPGPKSPRGSAQRPPSRVMGRKAPRKRLACRD